MKSMLKFNILITYYSVFRKGKTETEIETRLQLLLDFGFRGFRISDWIELN